MSHAEDLKPPIQVILATRGGPGRSAAERIVERQDAARDHRLGGGLGIGGRTRPYWPRSGVFVDARVDVFRHEVPDHPPQLDLGFPPASGRDEGVNVIVDVDRRIAVSGAKNLRGVRSALRRPTRKTTPRTTFLPGRVPVYEILDIAPDLETR